LSNEEPMTHKESEEHLSADEMVSTLTRLVAGLMALAMALLMTQIR